MNAITAFPMKKNCVLVALIWSLLGLGCATAATFTVDSTGDSSDPVPADGVCGTVAIDKTHSGGPCTLRAAIESANVNANTDAIQFNLPVGSVITTTSKLPDLSTNMSITGPGAAQLTVRNVTTLHLRIFNVMTSGTVTISGLTISNGSAGGLSNLGAGTLNVTSCTVTTNGNGTTLGAGIFNGSNGTANVTNSTIADNFSGDRGGGIYSEGTALNINNSTIIHNKVVPETKTSGQGGGISNFDGTVTITNSTISGNTCQGAGGGIQASQMTITNSTIAGNSAEGGGYEGGGIYGSFMNITNCTITGNSAQGAGGGIHTNDSVDPIGGSSMRTTTVKSSIVALNTATNSGPDVHGNFFTGRFNLIGKSDGSTGFGFDATDQLGAVVAPLDPKLDPNGLQNNGGPTKTVALLFGSPAIDKGTSALTALNSAVDSMATAINVMDASSTPAGVGYTILIDSEQMVVISKPNLISLTVTRGANGTTAASHSQGAVLSSLFDQRGTGFPRTFDDPNTSNANGGDGADIGAFELQTAPRTLANISTRLRVETGDNVLIGGFIVTGTQNKKVIVRAIGPSLPFADKLANPILELFGPSGLIESNDNWVDSPNKQAIIDSTIQPNDNLESAIVATLPANNAGYTAIVRGVNGGTGIGVVEAYDLDQTVDSKLSNISTRGLVQTGDNVLIAGTIIIGQGAQKVIVRGIGPSLAIAGNLQNPTLELRDQNGGLLQENDNWVDSANKQVIIDTTIPPTNDLESAIVATLPANGASYTAILRGVGNTTGIAVVEVYALN